MNVSQDILTLSEKTVFQLRALYKSFGYAQYKMSKFEEYDLYASNKSFLISDNVITFTDTDGKLMALKPDVTMSIIRNARPEENGVEKVFYDENVYRVSKGTHAYKEIMQAGLECIGDIDELCISEVLTMAAKSLALISDDYVIEISSAEILSDILLNMNVSDNVRAQLIKCVSERNLHDIKSICEKAGVPSDSLTELMRLNGDAESVMPQIKAKFPGNASDALESAIKALTDEAPAYRIKIDFSLVNDMNYYNGIVFRGYVKGVPASVLSGGQYGSLVRKMGKDYEAIGFAVYLDMLEELEETKDPDIDVAVIYEPEEAQKAYELCKKLRCEGKRVVSQRALPEKLRYKELIYVNGGKNNG